MSHNTKLITMFAVLIILIRQNVGCQLAFKVQAFFMPRHIVYHIWYPCTPVWSVNAPTAFCRCDKQRDGHGYFHFKKLLLCLTMQKLSPLRQTALKRPPTKRVLLLSPLLATLTPTLPLMASTFTDVRSGIYVLPIRQVISSPDASISLDVKKLLAPTATKPSLPSWLRRTENIAGMWQNATNANANATTLPGCHAIRSLRSTTATSPSCSFYFHTAKFRHFLHGLPLMQTVQDVYMSKY